MKMTEITEVIEERLSIQPTENYHTTSQKDFISLKTTLPEALEIGQLRLDLVIRRD